MRRVVPFMFGSPTDAVRRKSVMKAWSVIGLLFAAAIFATIPISAQVTPRGVELSADQAQAVTYRRARVTARRVGRREYRYERRAYRRRYSDRRADSAAGSIRLNGGRLLSSPITGNERCCARRDRPRNCRAAEQRDEL